MSNIQKLMFQVQLYHHVHDHTLTPTALLGASRYRVRETDSRIEMVLKLIPNANATNFVRLASVKLKLQLINKNNNI